MGPDITKFKVVLVGDAGVGKTSLIERYVLNKFSEKYMMTLGTRVYKKKLTIDTKGRSENIVLMIWDTMGQRRFEHVLRTALKGAQGAILVFDLTNRTSFDNLERWMRIILSISGLIPIVIAANKSDLKNRYEVKEHDINQTKKKYGFPVIMTSAKLNDNVNTMFRTIATEITKSIRGEKTYLPIVEYLGANLPAHEEILKQKESYTLEDIEDYIISKFCEYLGGDEHAMPMVRQQFKALGIDFTSPTLKDLKTLGEKFVEITKVMKGPEAARKLRMDILGVLGKYGKE